MYRVNYTQGNGYFCGRCRRTWDEHADFDTLEEAMNFALKLRVEEKLGEDVDIDEILETRDVPDWESILAERAAPAIEQEKARRAEAKQAEQKKEEEAKRKRELEQLESLKAKYEVAQ